MVAFAGVPGLEPRLTEPESVVLPITPYPTGCPYPGPPISPNQHRARMVVDRLCRLPLGCPGGGIYGSPPASNDQRREIG